MDLLLFIVAFEVILEYIPIAIEMGVHFFGVPVWHYFLNSSFFLIEWISFIGVSYRKIGKEILTRAQETHSELVPYNVKQAFDKNYGYWMLEA